MKMVDKKDWNKLDISLDNIQCQNCKKSVKVRCAMNENNMNYVVTDFCCGGHFGIYVNKKQVQSPHEHLIKITEYMNKEFVKQENKNDFHIN